MNYKIHMYHPFLIFPNFTRYLHTWKKCSRFSVLLTTSDGDQDVVCKIGLMFIEEKKKKIIILLLIFDFRREKKRWGGWEASVKN